MPAFGTPAWTSKAAYTPPVTLNTAALGAPTAAEYAPQLDLHAPAGSVVYNPNVTVSTAAVAGPAAAAYPESWT